MLAHFQRMSHHDGAKHVAHTWVGLPGYDLHALDDDVIAELRHRVVMLTNDSKTSCTSVASMHGGCGLFASGRIFET